MDFLYSIVGFILAIGILVTIHEFGHFYVAKLCKVKVLKFSIGFGPAKCIWQDCSGTKYLISAIPLGGYVELFDSQDPAVDPTIDLKLAINNKSAMDKILISLAGPMANFLLAIIAYWLVFIIGIATPTPIIGQISSDSIAGQARLVSGLEITKVANKTVNNWEDITIALIKQTQAKKKFVVIESYDRSHHKKSRHKLDISDPNLGKASEKILSAVGLLPYQFIDQKIWQVVPNSPADLAGIKVGDLIVTIDDLIMHNNQEVSKYLYDNPNKNVTLGVNRGQKILYINLIPQLKVFADNQAGGFIGIQYRAKPYPRYFVNYNHFGMVESGYRAILKTYDNILLTGYFIYSMFIGEFSIKNLSGPVAIGYWAGQSMKTGVEYFINFLAMISISLGLLNLLPFPWLDGGTIAYSAYSSIFDKQFSSNVVATAKVFSLIMLLFLMVFVLINDIIRL